MLKRIVMFIIAICSFAYVFYSSYMDISYFHEDMQSGADHVFIKANSYFMLFLSIIMMLIIILATIFFVIKGGNKARNSRKANIIRLILFMPLVGAVIYGYIKSEDYVLAKAAEKGYTVCMIEKSGSGRARTRTTIFALTANEQYCRGFKDMNISVKAAKKQSDAAKGR
jgi:Na+-driven multidrug efflux pump